MASPARSRWILAAVLLAGIATVWWIRRRPPEYPVAYVAGRAVTLYSTTAQVRQAVATLFLSGNNRCWSCVLHHGPTCCPYPFKRSDGSIKLIPLFS